ncbi:MULTISPECIES: hypothetical protein [Actinosynnema]|uniref:hypothetical protein n=1 Tax=Actinosynnema TaxID=40566 RepID=UPI0020A392F4|nr:hypothetical protein [Actinosynnema pretiosum]
MNGPFASNRVERSVQPGSGNREREPPGQQSVIEQAVNRIAINDIARRLIN